MDGSRGRRWSSLVAACIAGFFLCLSSLNFALDQERIPVLRSRAYRLRHLDGAEVKKQLELLEVGTQIDLLPHNALIVTSFDVGDLEKASSIIKLIDSERKYGIRVAGTWPRTAAFDGNIIARKLPDVTMGTFSEPPSGQAGNAVIVDVHKSRLLVVAPEKSLEGLTQTVRGFIPVVPPMKNAIGEISAVIDKTLANPVMISPTVIPATLKAAEQSDEEAPADANTVAEPATDAEGEAPPVIPPDEDIDKADLMNMLKALLPDAGAIGSGSEPADNTEADAVQESTEPNAVGDKAEKETKSVSPGVQKIQTRPAETTPGTAQPTPKPPIGRTPAGSAKPAAPSVSELAAAQENNGVILRPELEQKQPPAENISTTEPVMTEIIETTETGVGVEPEISGGEKEVQTVITMPEKVQIDSLIELVGKQLKLNYMYDPKLITGDVFLKIHDGKIKVKDMYSLLESVLSFKGFVMARRGNLVTIMQEKDAATMDTVLQKEGDEIQPGDVIVTRIFQLQHISTTTAQTMLQNMKLGISFMPIEDTGTLIVTGYAYRMAKMEEILAMIDIKGQEKQFLSRKLEYVVPSVLAAKLLTLVEELGTISITVNQQPTTPTIPTTVPRTTTTTSRTIPTRAIPTAPTAAKTPAGPSVFLDTDDRTNRILIIGLESDIETVNMLIDSLDVEKSGLKSVKEYMIQYVEATDVLDTLTELGIIGASSSRSSMYSRSAIASRTTTTRTTPTAVRPPTMPAVPGAMPTAGAAGEEEPLISVRLATNSLLVNASAEQHKDIQMIISFVDVKQTDLRTVKEYEIQYVDTTEVVDTLTELGIIETKQSSSSARRTSSTTPTTGSRMPTTMPGAAATPEAPATTTFESVEGAEITSEQPQIAVLESTNSLLVYATPKQHETIGIVISHVDRELTETSTPYVVYALENQDPVELAATLNDIIQATVKEAAKAADSKVQTTASTAPPALRQKNEIQIVADPKSYSLIVYADKKNQQWLSDLIKELDGYRPQVHLDVTLVEITKDNLFNYDLELVRKLSGFAAGGTMESGGLVTSLISPFPSRQVAEGSVKDGAGTAFFGDRHVQALLDMLDKKNYGRVLARPSLLVKDNQQGEIKAEKTIYVAQEKTSTVPTTANQSTTVSDVSFESYTSGVTLTITPHIASKEILQLEITLDRTDFVAGTNTTAIKGLTYPKPLDTVSSNVGTWAVLPDGATIILGGIESVTQNKTTQKVPLLGDIPILGALFRGVDETDVQSKLYVFVKANIISPSDQLTGASDIERISQKKRQKFETDEERFQKLEGVLPGIAPKPLDPDKVLEDDEYIKDIKAKKEQDDKVSVEIKLEPSTYIDSDDTY
jgi:type II secretory pathway component GspD/PulD (secretin)